MNPTEDQPVTVAIFAKAPIPGQVKTRLIPRLGVQGAADFQHRLLRRTLEMAFDAQLDSVSLWCTPSCAHPVFAACREAWGLALSEQRGDDLGARMLHAFSTLCPKGPVLLVGTDCPLLTVITLRRAAEALRAGRDAVFLPAEDGGYVLIGLHQPEPLLFENMPWGTHRVMAETRSRLSQLGWRWAEPEVLWDVDRPEDIDRLRASGLLDDWFREVGNLC
jgi:hypothetical protein